LTTGVVATFDDPAGHGTITTDQGLELFFHCTAIADGTRTVAPGTPVTFDEVPGHLGRWEATEIRSLSR
jgi:cold shock CspA family protein